MRKAGRVGVRMEAVKERGGRRVKGDRWLKREGRVGDREGRKGRGKEGKEERRMEEEAGACPCM